MSFERFSEYSQHVIIQHAKPEADLAVAWLYCQWELVSGATNPVLPGSQSNVITSIQTRPAALFDLITTMRLDDGQENTSHGDLNSEARRVVNINQRNTGMSRAMSVARDCNYFGWKYEELNLQL